jgi:hypothetical protein
MPATFARSKAFRVVAVLALLVGAYALAGFVLAPRLIRSALMHDIPEALGVSPSVGKIRVNPFRMHLEVEDFSLATPGGEQLLGFGRLSVDFEPSSLWRHAYSFAAIAIEAPTVNAIVSADGNLNLLQLRPKAPPAGPPTAVTQATLPSIRIGSFKVSNGSAAYEDRSRPTVFALRLEPIDFDLVNFTTGSEGGEFSFKGSSRLGERVAWHGHVSVQPVASDGELKIDALRAHTIWEYLADRLNFTVGSGTVDLDATYRFSLQDAIELQAAIPSLAIRDLAVRPKDADVDWIDVPSLTLGGASVNLQQRRAQVDSLTLTGLKVTSWMNPDGSINLSKLAQTPPTSPPSQTPPSTPAAAPWSVDLHEIELREANIAMEDRGTSPAAKLSLSPLSLRVVDVSSDPAKPLTISVDTRINESGSLSANGSLTPQPLSADIGLKLAGLDLTAIQPYIARHTSMTLLSGKVSGNAKIRCGPAGPKLRVNADIHVDGLRTIDDALHEDFIRWDRLDISGISLQHDPDRLDIAQIAARKLYARVIVEPDDSLNVKRVLGGPGATAAPMGQGAMPQAAAAIPARQAAAPMPISIRKIALHSSQASFADRSVQPNFSASIQSIEGTVLGLSSKPNARAKVDIHGAVGQFSPVAVSGEVKLAAPLYTDLALSFRNMELSIFNPYSGKFAGYNITKGKLTTELRYKVEGRKLDAQHHIIVDDLQFGDRTASKDAVSLPVKLAVALLKDRNGVIDLNLPVAGTLDDPAFRLAPVLWEVFVNILEKAATAPFALLSSLFGGGHDLQFIDFAPGVAELGAGVSEQGRGIVKALTERPQLKIEVPIGWVRDLDAPALVEAKFLAQVHEAQLGKGGRKGSVRSPPEYAQLDLPAKVDLLTRLYRQDVGGEPHYPPTFGASMSKSELLAAKMDFLSREVHRCIAITDADLDALGQQRATAVQQLLLADTELDPARVFLVANDKAKDEAGKVRLELSLQ